MRLVNTDKAVDITFEAGIEPKALLKMIGDAGHPGTIGLISLRALLEGTGESEINGYMVITEADEVEATELKEATADFAAVQSEQSSGSKTEGELIEESQDQEQAAEAVVAAAEGAAEAVVEEVAAATDAAGKVESAEGAEPVVESQEAAGSAADAVKQVFGINMSKEGEGAALTPAPTTTASASRPRRDLGALIEKAMKGSHGPLLTAATAAGYVITNVENSERWFGLSVGGDHPVTRMSPRFDVSPLKNGAYSVSLYLNDRATGLKEKLVAAEGAPVTNEAIIASMAGPLFKDAIAGWKPEAPKAS